MKTQCTFGCGILVRNQHSLRGRSQKALSPLKALLVNALSPGEVATQLREGSVCDVVHCKLLANVMLLHHTPVIRDISVL